MAQFWPPLASDTGWVPIVSFASGWSASGQGSFPAGAVRRIGRVVHVRGLFAKSSWGLGEGICTLPEGFWPTAVADIPGNPVAAYAQTSGLLTTNSAGTNNFLLTGSFVRD